jgi:hypothetical protein
MEMHELEGYDEIIRKIVTGLPLEHVLAAFKPEQRLAGLPPEQAVLALPDEPLAAGRPPRTMRRSLCLVWTSPPPSGAEGPRPGPVW